jgi:hypothetical protein
MRRGLISRSLVELPDAALDARLDRLRAAMAGLDAVMAYTNHTRPAAVSWLTGFVPYWSEAMLVVPRVGSPALVVALTFRVKPWIERTSRVAQVIHTPRIGLEAARLVAAATADGAVGVVDLDHLATGIADDLREGGPKLSFTDAGPWFAALRGAADPAELMLAMRAAAIAGRALSVMPPRAAGIGAMLGAVEGEARRLGAEEVLVAAAPDLARDTRLKRIEGEPPLGARFALRASVAYKGSWVRRVVTVEPDGATAGQGVREAFAAAVAQLPDPRGFAPFASFLVEGCRTAQPLEPLMGSRVAEPRPPAAGAVVSVQAALTVDGQPVLLGAPALIGAGGAASGLLDCDGVWG